MLNIKFKFLVLLFCCFLISSSANAEIIEFDKCHLKFNHSDDKPNTWQNLDYEFDNIIFSANLISGKLTSIFIWKKDTKTKNISGGKMKRETSLYRIVSFTKSEIIARSYYIDNPMLRELMINPNDDTAVHKEVVMDLKNNKIIETINPTGQIIFDRNLFKRLGGDDSWKSTQKQVTYTHLCNSPGNDATGNSSGSAFFINNIGNLVTNHHVIEGCKELSISYFDKEYKANVLHSDKNLDLAVLKADVRPKDHISVSKNPPKKLQNIFAAGYPLGKGLSDDLKITSGIISSIKGFKDNVNEIQIDAAINSGNSGGPIVSENGYLVGISVSGLDKSKTESVNFGIKASSLEQFLNVNEIKYSKPFYEFSSNKDSLRKLLENSTVYISCKT